ncbi:MAG: DNA gyrase subunit A [Pseudomonadota bacterium]
METNLIRVNIEDEMKTSYMSYAMSVIVGRALPDVRDGFKPVHRRVMYAMSEMNNYWNKSYKKSARVVGDVIGKYHPHGDTAVYDTIVRMAQDFSLRYPLVDGQGNFGSVDGDSPAAMRYTEVRLDRIASEMLEDLDKETVDFTPNYDESLFEPSVLPSKLPNLLINGSSGIAVGMATNIPPHNLGEIVDAIIYLIDNADCEIKDLIKIVPGPDFPTGGYICGKDGIVSAYKTGRGIVRMRGKANVEPMGINDRERIVITELPYQVNKARLVEKIAELAKDKKIEGISDIRDESDRTGMRMVIELKKDIISTVILNQLFKHTALESTFGIIMLAIVDKMPRVLNLKEVLVYFVEHRKEIVTRRTIFELKKAEARLHILEGLKIAIENIDEVIEIIKKSADAKVAKEKLIKRFDLSDKQSQAILDMRLHRLTGLEQDKLVTEYEEVIQKIKEYKEILADEKLLFNIIKEELIAIKKLYNDDRRTEITSEIKDMSLEDLIQDEEMVVTISHTGYIKRNSISSFKSQKRGGKGVTGMTTKDEDFLKNLFIASMHSYILAITNRGKLYWLKVHNIPEGARIAKGKPIVNLLNLSEGEIISAILTVREFTEGSYIVMLTKKGIIKKTDLMSFSNPRSGGIIALNIKDDDQLMSADLTNGKQDIFITTRNGMSIRFKEAGVRPMGRTAAGVKGINLKKDDKVVGMEILDADSKILTVTEKGFGKCTLLQHYRIQSRGGTGIFTIKVTEKNGHVVGTASVFDKDRIMIITNGGKLIKMRVQDISTIGRNTQGVKLISVNKNELVTDIAIAKEDEECE